MICGLHPRYGREGTFGTSVSCSRPWPVIATVPIILSAGAWIRNCGWSLASLFSKLKILRVLGSHWNGIRNEGSSEIPWSVRPTLGRMSILSVMKTFEKLGSFLHLPFGKGAGLLVEFNIMKAGDVDTYMGHLYDDSEAMKRLGTMLRNFYWIVNI